MGAGRIVFVTGKGGTGKSFVAQALARAAVARGRSVALVRTRPEGATAIEEGKAASGHATASIGQRSRPGDRPLPYDEIVLDEREALESFLVRILRVGFLARRLLDSRTFSAVAAAAPGVRDLVTLLAITALSRPGMPRDLLIVDAPATGHSIPLLTAPGRILELAPIGPVAREARMAMSIIGNPERFSPIIMTTPEELAVNEALTLHQALLRADVAQPRVVVNGVWPSHMEARDADWLLTSAVSTDAALHWRRRRRQLDLIEMLEKRVGASRTLPFAFQEGELPVAAVGALLTDLLDEAPGPQR